MYIICICNNCILINIYIYIYHITSCMWWYANIYVVIWSSIYIAKRVYIYIYMGASQNRRSGTSSGTTPVPYPRSIPPWRIRSIPLFHTSDPYVMIYIYMYLLRWHFAYFFFRLCECLASVLKVASLVPAPLHSQSHRFPWSCPQSDLRLKSIQMMLPYHIWVFSTS